MKRVVVTGMSGITALGDTWSTIEAGLKQKQNTVVNMQEWHDVAGLHTCLAAPVTDFVKPKHYSRKQTRSMGRVSLMATRASEVALQDAGLLEHPSLTDGSTGIAYGSSIGSTPPITAFGDLLADHNMNGINATSYIQMMSHTTAVNVGVFFGIKGRVYTTSSACTSGSQAIGYGYEAIKYGQQKLMLVGGGEELCLSEVAVFDCLYATSTANDTPKQTPKPFDQDRDGLVIGEGAASLVLEELDHALARGATIYAEVVGYGTNSDGVHVTQPTGETMATAMKLALKDANIAASEIGYVNAHGTATTKGDLAESQATEVAIGKGTPISTLKGYLGHTLGACGAIEAWCSIEMMNQAWFAPNINLTQVDAECGDLDYITGEGKSLDTDHIMSNNFAFGGINTSLIFKRWQQ